MPGNKTRLQALFEVLPNIDMDDDGYPWFCIEAYDNTQKMKDHHDDCLNGCKVCKKRFWEEIMPDQKKESSDLHAIIDEIEDRIYKPADRIAALEEYQVESMNEQKRTNKDVLLAAFPDVRMNNNGIPEVCPILLNENYPCYKFASCNECKHTHWLAEVEE